MSNLNETLFTIWYPLHYLKNWKVTHGGVLSLVNFAQHSPMGAFLIFSMNKLYQVAQSFNVL